MDPELAERLTRHGTWLDDAAPPLAPRPAADPGEAAEHEGVRVVDIGALTPPAAGRRRGAFVAAALLAAAAIVAVALVVRTPTGGSGTDDGSTGQSTGLELDGRHGDVLVVAESTLAAGDLTLAADAQGLADLWSSLTTTAPPPAIDFATSVVLAMTVVGNSCVPSLGRLERTDGPTYTPAFATAATSCLDLAVIRTFVVRVDRSAIEPHFVLRLPAYLRWYDEQRLEVDLGAGEATGRLLTPAPVRQGVPTTAASELSDPPGPATDARSTVAGLWMRSEPDVVDATGPLPGADGFRLSFIPDEGGPLVLQSPCGTYVAQHFEVIDGRLTIGPWIVKPAEECASITLDERTNRLQALLGERPRFTIAGDELSLGEGFDFQRGTTMPIDPQATVPTMAELRGRTFRALGGIALDQEDATVTFGDQLTVTTRCSETTIDATIVDGRLRTGAVRRKVTVGRKCNDAAPLTTLIAWPRLSLQGATLQVALDDFATTTVEVGITPTSTEPTSRP